LEAKIMKKGFTLLEILVVVAIFSILGVLVTRAIILSIGGSKKSESLVRVRENLDYASGVIERQLRNANSIPECPNTDTSIINYEDENGKATSFSCVDVGASGRVASGSANLTSSQVSIIACSFTCQVGINNTPSTVEVSMTAKDATATGVQGAEVSVVSRISLRNY
jgi:prepilin-type N-terminal cleavage/methylation domain-containing protein